MNSHGTSVGYHECGKRKAGYIPVWGWFNNHFPYSLGKVDADVCWVFTSRRGERLLELESNSWIVDSLLTSKAEV